MALTLVLGPANSAKAGEVLGAYRLAARRDALLVVPTALDVEYYERELCAEGLLLGRALTFAELIDEIAARVGVEAEAVNERQRERLLRQLVAGKKLQALGGATDSPGFTRATARLCGALGQSRVSTPRLGRALREWAASGAASTEYAAEIVAIYELYRAELERRSQQDREQFSWNTLDVLRSQPDRWGRTAVFIYGFDDFTPIEFDAITTLAKAIGVEVTVSMTYEAGREALAARAAVVEDLKGRAERVVELAPLDSYYEPCSRVALHHLERELFRPDAQPLDPGEAVQLIEAQGEMAEAEAIAERVAKALAAGIDPAEIVVVVRSLTRSGTLLERTLCRRGISTMSARQVPFGHTALGRGTLALLRLAQGRGARLEVEDLLAYLRTPGAFPETVTLDALEARLRRGGQRRIEGASAIGRLCEHGPGAQAARLAIDAGARLWTAEDPVAVTMSAVQDLLAGGHQHAAEVLAGVDEIDARAAAAAILALQQCAGIDRTLDDVLDLLGSISVRVGASPTERSVLIAEPLAIRARRFRHVLIAGLCVGEWPTAGPGEIEPFFGEDGRRSLAVASGLVLAVPEDRDARERYLLYAALSRATEWITLSYRSSDEAGDPVSPSPFLDDLEAVLGSEWRQRALRFSGSDFEPVPIAGTTPEPDERMLSPVALAQVRHAQLVSASALEQYARCPVSWLVDRQLHLQDLQPDSDPQARGSCMHALLERVLRELGETLSQTNLAKAFELLDQHVEDRDLDPAPGRPAQVKAARMRAIRADLRRYLRHEAQSGSRWRTVAFEQRFGEPPSEENPSPLPPLALGTGEFQLRGVIDRIDVDASGQRALIRDYKSGKVDSNRQPAKWLENDDLQVALYMLAVKRLLGLTPVGGIYQPLTGGELRARGVSESGLDVPVALFGGHELSEPEIEQLAAGELQPRPDHCSHGAAGCRYPGICWAER